MRLAIKGDSFVERLAVRLRSVPRPAIEAWGGLALSGTLVAAVDLGIFARLAAGPQRVADLADGLDEGTVGMIIECLASTGYLRRRTGASGPSVALTAAGRRWLAPRAARSMAAFVQACADYGPWWSRLAEVARTGHAIGQHDREATDAYWRRYLLGQRDLARLVAPEVVRKIRLGGGPRRVLDIGGGHGWYAMALCRRFPQAEVIVLDLPGAVAVGAEAVADAGLAGRIRFAGGDARSTPLGTGHDAVLCFNLVHHLADTEVTVLLRRAAEALAPDGTLYVLDAFETPGRRVDPAWAYTSLFMRLASGGRMRTHEAMRAMLVSAGLPAIRTRPVRRMPGLYLYAAQPR